MFYKWFCFVLLVGFNEWADADIPSYIKVCRKGADFKACAIKSGNDALPFILKGDRKYNIPNMLPLKLPEVQLQDSPNLKLKFQDLNVYGLDTITVKDVGVDFDKHVVFLTVFAKTVSLVGSYEVDGKVLVLPVTGTGPCNITFVNADIKYTVSYTLEDRDGVEYAMIQPGDNLEFTVESANFNFEHLFNGNQEMGDNVNAFLNQNQQDVLNEFRGVMSGTIAAIARQISIGFFGNIPYKELFID